MDTGQDILNTGWAWIETKWDIIAKKQHKIGSGGHMAPHLNSVQWCEARAILDIIQNMETNTIAHIHTDSKGTIQGLRSIITKPYKVMRNVKNKDILWKK